MRAGVGAAALLAALAGTPAAWAFRDEPIVLTLDDGRTLAATLRRPADAPGPLPALMLFGGFRGAARVLDRVRLERPVAWASFDYPFEGPRKFSLPGSLRYAPELRSAIHGTFEGVGKLHAALRARRDIDPARITIVGTSAGAPFATVGAAAHGIPGVVLVQGFADAAAVLQHLLVRRYARRYGDWVEWPALWFAKWILWYCEAPDLAAHARRLRAHQRVLVITARDDDHLPRRAAQALVDAVAASAARHEHLELPGGHLGFGDDNERIAELLRRAGAWLEAQELI